MSELPKHIRKQMRELISTAYSRELNRHLEELALKFDQWRKEVIDCWELSNMIHEFHDGISRDLYKMYNYGKDEDLLVARAIVHGLLSKDEVSDELREFTKKFEAIIKLNQEVESEPNK